MYLYDNLKRTMSYLIMISLLHTIILVLAQFKCMFGSRGKQDHPNAANDTATTACVRKCQG